MYKFIRGLRAILILTILAIKEIIFVHKCFLYTLFRPSISDVSSSVKLNIGYWNKLQLKTILLLRFIFKDQFWGQQWYKKVHDSILNNLKQQELNSSQFKMPVPVVKLEDISPSEFWNKYVKTSTPVIIKGGALHTVAYQNWTAEMFSERFGNFKVRTSEPAANKPFVGTLKEFVDSKNTDRQLYLPFSAGIFSAHPELLKELDCLSFNEYLGGKTSFFIAAQLFLGVHQASGSNAHCANSPNLFFQIRGKKKWTFIHPDHLWLMYPMLDREFGFCASLIRRQYDEHYLDKYAPLHNYCPKHEAILEPGDILFNPAWIWHAVDNLTDETVAVATRWLLLNVARSNTFFDLMQLLAPKTWKDLYYFFSRRPEDPSVLDKEPKTLIKTAEDFIELGNNSLKNAGELSDWPENYRF